MNNNYLYISIPKTGSNSVHNIIGNNNFNHIKAITIKNKLGNKYDKLNSFCFFREPISLVKSWYYYHKFSPNVIRKDVKDFYPDTIEEWIFDMNCKTHWETLKHKNYNPDWDLSNPLFQKKWITDNQENIIVKNVYIFDNLDKEIKRMFNKEIKHLNKSSKNNYQLTDKVINKIKEIFKEDIRYYNSLF